MFRVCDELTMEEDKIPPVILDGEFFTIVEKDFKPSDIEVKAKCNSCPQSTKNVYRGTFKNSSNFLTHLKVMKFPKYLYELYVP